jgi:hypothetical protein
MIGHHQGVFPDGGSGFKLRRSIDDSFCGAKKILDGPDQALSRGRQDHAVAGGDKEFVLKEVPQPREHAAGCGLAEIYALPRPCNALLFQEHIESYE